MNLTGRPLPASTASAREWAEFYHDQGVIPIPVPFKSKAPVVKGWQKITLETARAHFNGEPSNTGLLLGASGLADIDLDCELARLLAPSFLPGTACKFGRKSVGITHYLYRLAGEPLKRTPFTDVELGPDGKRKTLLEVRCDRVQTIVPGSVHPEGEHLEYIASMTTFEPAVVDPAALMQCARRLAAAVLLAKHWPEEGDRHEAAMCVAGLLARLGLLQEDAELIAVAAAREGDDDEAYKRRTDVITTYERFREKQLTTGGLSLAKMLRGDGAGVVKTLKEWFLKLHISGDATWASPDERPVIVVNALDLRDMRLAAWKAIVAANEPRARIFRYGTGLAWLAQDLKGKTVIQMIDQERTLHHLSNVASFVRETRNGTAPTFPPPALAADLMKVPSADLPVLHRMVSSPVFLADGRLLLTPGYDPESGVYFAPPRDFEIPAVPDQPTQDDIKEALNWILREHLVDFPFRDASDRIHALALYLTPFLRELIDGDVPLFVVDKPSPRTGGSLMVNVITTVQMGKGVSVQTLAGKEEEVQKKLTSALIESPEVIVFDNRHGLVNSQSLASVLTAHHAGWTDRILGKSLMVTLPVSSVFVLTGNNVLLSSENAGRAVMIRMYREMADPGSYTGFRHPNIVQWTKDHRPELLWSALVLGQAWVAAGRRRWKGPHFGGYEEWTAVLGGVLEIAAKAIGNTISEAPTDTDTIGGFLANRSALFVSANEETATIAAFLSEWLEVHQTAPVTTKELFDIARTHTLDIVSKTEQGR
jgi:bifunctional DNA primase/polymerase-like protein